MAEIINRVKNSSLITLDISNLYDNRDRVNLDFSKLLDNGILIEKQFRENLKNYDWSSFDGKYQSLYSPFSDDSHNPIALSPLDQSAKSPAG